MSAELLRIEVHLLDGRMFVLDGAPSTDELFALFAREQITPEQIQETRHVLRLHKRKDTP